MANSSQARKRARQSEVRRLHNGSARAMMRSKVKKVVKAIDAGDRTAAEATYKAAAPALDRAAEKDLIHKNKAARHKSLLNARIKAMS